MAWPRWILRPVAARTTTTRCSTLNRRFASGLTFGSQWTWSHSLGNTGGSNEANTTQDPTNFGPDRGNNNFDVRHSVNITALYELPYHASKLKSAFQGWQIGEVLNFNSGLPFEVRVTRPDIVYRDIRN